MSLFSPQLTALAQDVVNAARRKNLHIVTAESCTGGLLSGCLTEIAGVSSVLDCGFITYSNDSKMAQLAVEQKTLANFGAVSSQVAIEMAKGALRASHADLAISITGIAGPGGGTAEKPVGLVYIAVADRRKLDAPIVLKNNFNGDRTTIRLAAIIAALTAALKMI
jgi:nicotinamide-nucleotide amidase